MKIHSKKPNWNYFKQTSNCKSKYVIGHMSAFLLLRWMLFFRAIFLSLFHFEYFCFVCFLFCLNTIICVSFVGMFEMLLMFCCSKILFNNSLIQNLSILVSQWISGVCQTDDRREFDSDGIKFSSGSMKQRYHHSHLTSSLWNLLQICTTNRIPLDDSTHVAPLLSTLSIRLVTSIIWPSLLRCRIFPVSTK